MNTKETGAFLKTAFPVDSSPLNDILKDAESALHGSTVEPALFSPFIVLNLPQAYLNREGRRVDICGMVDASTKEYMEGYRYYSSNALFFFEDGTCTPNTQCPNDLVSIIDDFDLHLTTSPLPISKWVHPVHYSESSFFESLERSLEPLRVTSYYLNRMGFVVEITAEQNNVQAQQQGIELRQSGSWFTDTNNQVYQADGKLCNSTPSMYDLVYEIVNWDLFGKTDWASQTLFRLGHATANGNMPPELFNPIGESRLEKKKRMFDLIIEVSAIAKDIGVVFGFHMNDDMPGATQ